MDTVTETSVAGSGAPDRMSVAGEVLAVLRLAFTLRLDARRLVGRDATIALLGGAALAVWTLLPWWREDDPVDFNPAGLTAVAACAALALALAWLLSRCSVPALPLRHTVWLVAGYLPAAAGAIWLFNAPITPTQSLILACSLAAHAGLYFFFGLRALSAAMPWRPFGVGVAAIASMVLLVQVMPKQPGPWTVHQTPDQIADYQESQQRAEALLYAQPDRIDAALSSLRPRAAGPHAYFLGFAGYGGQKVFAREIALAAQRINERFGSNGRAVLLVNDRQDYDRHPLASRSALERALRGLAAHMDVEQDVLFLALSSHGKNDAYLVVDNGALPLEKLTAKSLAGMLRESGIRWKVLVISACYAGSFIEPLRDEYTIVIAASAPHRASFGCNDRRELTYFGEAFYRDAFPAAPDLRAAFDAAAADIAARERKEGLLPSMPQAHFGARIEKKLAELTLTRVTDTEAARAAKTGPASGR
jgi:hypothetical protein